VAYNKKLIEVALPLEAINLASAREKSIRHGHPSTLHLWWARRPLATARAVIWSSLVDDPSAHPDLFDTEEAQAAERERLFRILEKLVLWENSNDAGVLAEAKAEIMKSTGGNPPALLDPFAGGGAIPLEAQRLGLTAHASDLNPVAVMINKAMIEIPPKFAGKPPVNPASAHMRSGTWNGAVGLAEDVRYYGEWMKREAYQRIGHLYPKVRVPEAMGGGEATVIAWIWARTVKCPNPACGCEMPLASSFVLSKKKGNEAYIVPEFDYENKKIHYTVLHGSAKVPEAPKMARGVKFKCIMCGTSTMPEYIKDESVTSRMGARLLAVVAEGKNGRVYISPTMEQEDAALISRPEDAPSESLPFDPRNIWCVNYGLDTYDKLFTNRQLTALTTFSDLVAEAQKQAGADAVAAGLVNDGIPLSEGGTGARAYGEAVGSYLSFSVDKMADINSCIVAWNITRDGLRNTFSRQAIPMTWDYAEANPFSQSSGSFDNCIDWIAWCICDLPANMLGCARQFDAQSDNGLRDIMVSTDPPYYDNIGYADLSDFFYVWMRRTMKDTYPKLFRTMLVPKVEELVATPYRFDGSVERARDFFEDGMYHTFCQVYAYARDDVPVTIYYAFKQSESEEDDEADTQTASTGWETMLSAVLRAGFAITGTWPMRTERAVRTIASGTNALASSIVLVCRKRAEDAPVCTRREFVNALKREMKPALRELQKANIAPVDLQQSAIGPGMGVYSRYKNVLEAGGEPMRVRAALQIINQELDAFFNEQEGELDRDSRLCVEIFSQYAFSGMKFGDADNMARAKNTSVSKLEGTGVIEAIKGNVRLKTREEIPEKVNPGEENIWLLTQQLIRAMEAGGVEACAKALAPMRGGNVELAKALAYRLYSICERKAWAQEAFAANALIVAWPDIVNRAASLTSQTPEQTTFDLID
jgi:putative DNA methylase